MSTKIKPDYQPSKRVYELLANRYGIPIELAREFTGHQIPEFRMYWENTGKAKTDWDTTCLNWVSRNYENKKEKMAQNRNFTSQGNIFEQAVESLGKQPEPVIQTRARVVSSPIPGDGQTMSRDEALAELSRMRLA